MSRVGKPSKLTPELKRKFIDAIAAGAHYEVACEYVGIDYSTFRKWMQKGEGTYPGGKSYQYKEYVDFFEAVKEAEAKGEVSAIAAIRGANKTDWRSAAWMLERRYPDRWTKKSKIIEALQILASNGLLIPGQAEVVSSGIEEMISNLYHLSDVNDELIKKKMSSSKN